MGGGVRNAMRSFADPVAGTPEITNNPTVFVLDLMDSVKLTSYLEFFIRMVSTI